LCKNILSLYRYRDFRVGIFYFASPCISLSFIPGVREQGDLQYFGHNFDKFIYNYGCNVL